MLNHRRTRNVIPALALASALLPAFTLAQPEAPAAFQDALRDAAPGDVLVMGFNPVSAPALNAPPDTLVSEPGHLIYSDDPETVSGEGILYSGTIDGDGRVYTYHVNDDAVSRNMALVLENPGSTPVGWEVTDRVLVPPSGNYTQVGRIASMEMLMPSPTGLTSGTLQPGQRVLADPMMPQRLITRDQLFHTVHDLTTDGPVLAHVVMLGINTDPIADFDSLSMLPDDGFEREGTFSELARKTPSPFAYDTAGGVRRIRVGGAANDLDLPPQGVDEVSGEAASLRGAYGVIYELDVDVTSSDGRAVAVLLNPRGGGYGGWLELTTGGETAGTFVPRGAGTKVPTTTHAGFIGMADEGPLTIRLTPAGASSLAVDVLLVPFTAPVDSDTWSVD